MKSYAKLLDLQVGDILFVETIDYCFTFYSKVPSLSIINMSSNLKLTHTMGQLKGLQIYDYGDGRLMNSFGIVRPLKWTTLKDSDINHRNKNHDNLNI